MASKTSVSKTSSTAPKVVRVTKKSDSTATPVVASDKKVVSKSKSVESKPTPVVPAPVSETISVDTPSVDVVSDDRKLTTSEDVVNVVNNVVLQLKNEIMNAKARKDRDAASKLVDAVKHLNSIRKPIDKLARSKPPRKKVVVDPSKNGLLMPVQLSPELCKFLGCPESETKSRVQVTRAICQYIQENNLKNPKNGREIIPDAALQRLLDFDPSKEGSHLLYYQIQTRIQRHYIKPTVSA
jgi:chromatin remodeling complex protein RSC6